MRCRAAWRALWLSSPPWLLLGWLMMLIACSGLLLSRAKSSALLLRRWLAGFMLWSLITLLLLLGRSRVFSSLLHISAFSWLCLVALSLSGRPVLFLFGPVFRFRLLRPSRRSSWLLGALCGSLLLGPLPAL